MMKKYLLLLIFIVVTTRGFAVPPPEHMTPLPENFSYLPKSPEVAAFMRYFEIPVNHSRGLHNVSIPIHTLQGGGIELPISLSYHAAGVKVRDVATSAGLGWSLNSGGTIVQNIRGNIDGAYMPMASTHIIDSLMADADSKRPNNSLMHSAYIYYLFEMLEQIRYRQSDYLADEYRFNMADQSGIFYSDVAEGNARGDDYFTIPASPMKIQYDKTSKKFTLIDPSGKIYLFSKRLINGTPTGNPSYCIWYLEKITSPDGNHELTIEYGERATYLDYVLNNWERKGCYAYWIYDSYEFTKNGHWEVDGNPSKTPWHQHEYVINDQYLPTKITLNNTTVEFIYDDSRDDLRSFGSRSKRLKEVVVKEMGTPIKKLSFDHRFITNKPWKNLNNNRMFLSAIHIEDVGAETEQPLSYRFSYNESLQLPTYYDRSLPKEEDYVYPEDHWGYYNGKQNSHLMPGLGADRQADPNYVQAGILTKIQYPTGGFARFTYDANEKGGGVRI